MRHAVLIVDGTRLCNLRCSYCNNWRAGPDWTMSFSVLARLTASVLRDPQHDAVAFNWHGGETTLLPISFYQKALLLQARFRRPKQSVTNSIQTNGTRLTSAWAQFLRDSRFTVGVSLDGPPEIHDRYRLTVSGGPTLSQVLRGIAILREYRIPFSVIMVVDQSTLEIGADRIFDFFLDQGIYEYALNFAVPAAQPAAQPGTPTGHYARPAQVERFLMQLYDRWFKHGDRRISIRELDALRHSLARGTGGPCTLTGGCFGSVYRVEANGDVGHCDYFAADERYKWGNILSCDFAAIRENSKLADRDSENIESLKALCACPNFQVCKGWCPYQRYVSLRHNPDYQEDCCGLNNLISHIRAREFASPIVDDLNPGRGAVNSWSM